MSDRKTVMVTGASGAIGRKVVELLLDGGRHHVVAGTRTPASLDDLAGRGAEVRQLDLSDFDSLADRFSGVDRLLIISTDAVFSPGHRLQQHRSAIAGAVKAGVEHIVYTSMPNPEPPALIFYSADHFGTEQALKASGVTYTILRNGWYSEITYPILQSALDSGEWVTAAGAGRVPYVARDDCSAAAAAVLSKGIGGNQTFNLTGPDALSVDDMAAIAERVFDVPIAAKHVTPKQKADFLPSCGVTPEFVPVIILSDVNTQLERNGPPTGDVETLTGQRPKSYEEVLIERREGERGLRIGGEGTIFGPASAPVAA